MDASFFPILQRVHRQATSVITISSIVGFAYGHATCIDREGYCLPSNIPVSSEEKAFLCTEATRLQVGDIVTYTAFLLPYLACLNIIELEVTSLNHFGPCGSRKVTG